MGNPHDEEMYSRKAIAANRDFIGARLYLAGLSMPRENRMRQSRYIVDALAIAPNNGDTHNYLGLLLLQNGRIR